MKIRSSTISTLVAGFMLLSPLSALHAKEGAIQCANLIYGGTQTSRCFSDEFLSTVQKETSIPTERRFKSVKLDSDELFEYPFVIMTGEADFHLSKRERENMTHYLENGGLLIASAGCSNKDFDMAFRREIHTVCPDEPLSRISKDHAVFRTVYEIDSLELHKAGSEAYLEGISLNDKLVVIYSSQGLNDTGNTEGCCCCGGNEVENSLQVNVNIFIYALLH